MKRSMWVCLLLISIFSFIACTKYETEKLNKEDKNELEQVRKIYVAKYDKKK